MLILPSRDTTSADLERRLVVAGTPQVLFARQIAGHEADYAGVDDVRAGRLLGEHFASAGCRRVAFLGGPPRSSARRERQRGLSLGLRRHGITLDRALSIATGSDRAGGIDAAETLLRTSPAPDAVAGYSDVVAFGVMSALRSAGLEPGLDVAVGGLDDIPTAALQYPR